MTCRGGVRLSNAFARHPRIARSLKTKKAAGKPTDCIVSAKARAQDA